MPRLNRTGRKLGRKSISSVAPSRPGQFAYDPNLDAVLVSEGGQWVRYGEVGFSPASLFAAGEPGLWYDLSALFQDHLGTIPAAVGQPVGLMLDKSKGLTALGPDLFVGFPVGIGSWVDNGDGSWSIDGTQTDPQDLNGDNSIIAPNSAYLEWAFTISGLPAGRQIAVYLGPNMGTFYTNGTHRVRLLKDSWFVRFRAPPGLAFTVSGVSVREVLGNHAYQPTVTARPTLGRVPKGGRRNRLISTENFSHSGLSWTSGGHDHVLVEVFPGMTGYAIIPENRAYAVYDRTNAAWIITTTPWPVESGRFSFRFTAPPGCEQANIYPSRGSPQIYSSASNSVVTPGQTYTVSMHVNNGRVGGVQVEEGSVMTPYQRVGTNAYDVTEAGVETLHYLDFDGVDDFLQMNTPVDLLTGHMFLVVDYNPALEGVGFRWMGRNASSLDGGRAEVHTNVANSATALRRWDGTAYSVAPWVGMSKMTPSIKYLYEVARMAVTRAITAYLNGAQQGAAAGSSIPAAWVDFLVDRIGVGATAPSFGGKLYEFVLTDWQEERVQPLREYLDDKSGAGLPTPTPQPEPAPPPAAVTIAPIDADNWLTSIGKEQSLGLGANTGQSVDPDGNTNAKPWAAALHNGKALMLTGLKRADGVNQNMISGPLAVGYDTSFPATGETLVANANMGNAPIAYLIFCELSRRGLFGNQFVPMFTNASGQSILQLDDDLPTQTGTGVTTFYENFVFTFQQIAARAAANSKQARALFDLLIQGEAEASAAPEVWLDGYREVDKDQRAALVASGYTASDVVIPKLIFQTGGYVNGATLDHNVSLEQLRVVREGGAIFAGPISQFLVADNNVHPDLAEYARMATLGAWAFEENYHGRGFNLLSASHEVIGNTVVIRYPMRPGEALRSINGKFDAYGGNPFGGFEVTGGASIVSAAPSETIPGAMVVTLDRPAAGLGTLKLGRQKKDMREFAVGTSNYGSQRVGWAGTHTSNSLIWPGAVAERVLPSEEWTI